MNLSDTRSAGLVRTPWNDVRGHRWILEDPTNNTNYERDGDALAEGLYVELGPWAWHLFRVQPVVPGRLP